MRAALIGAIAASRQVSGGDWFTVSERTGGGDVNSTGWGGYTFRMVIPASAIIKDGSKFRLTFFPSGAGPTVIDDAFVGEGAASGETYAFAGAPTRITFGGNNSVSATESTDTVSDGVNLAVDETKNLVVALYFSSSSALRSIAPAADVGQTYHYKLGNDAATESATGYTETTAGGYSFRKVELFG